MSDGTVLGISFVYVAAVVGVSEGLRRGGLISFDLSRKIIHIGIGTWIVPTVLLFRSQWWAIIPPAIFVVLNLLSLRGKWSRAMDAEAGSNIGTVLFPLSFVILLLGLWNAPGGKAATAAGLLALAWGDAAAALVGKRWGRRRYRVGEGWRSLEGSAAMFAFSLVAVAAAGLVVARRGYPAPVLIAAAAAATLLEAGSRRGLDNLLVPVGTAGLVWALAHTA